jgi:hypothetical protein
MERSGTTKRRLWRRMPANSDAQEARIGRQQTESEGSVRFATQKRKRRKEARKSKSWKAKRRVCKTAGEAKGNSDEVVMR